MEVSTNVNIDETIKFIIVRTQTRHFLKMKIHHDKEDYFLKLDKGVVLEEKKIV